MTQDRKQVGGVELLTRKNPPGGNLHASRSDFKPSTWLEHRDGPAVEIDYPNQLDNGLSILTAFSRHPAAIAPPRPDFRYARVGVKREAFSHIEKD